jgi:predicted phage tail protein
MSTLRVIVRVVRDVLTAEPIGTIVPTLPVGASVADAVRHVPRGWLPTLVAHGVCLERSILHNGMALTAEQAQRRTLTDGDVVVVAPRPGDFGIGTAILIAIAVASAAASAFIALSAQRALPAAEGSLADRRYGFARYSTPAALGETIPVVLGRVVRYGGRVVSVLPGAGEDGNARMRVLICLGHGPIKSAGSLTADTTDADASTVGGVYLNEQPLAAFPGCRVSFRRGTAGQAAIPGFDEAEVLRETSPGGLTLRNTSGSDRDPAGAASAEARTYSTVDPVDSLTVRVRFPRGLYTTTGSGQTNPRSVRYRVRTRTSDTGSGAGAWSGWTIVTVSRAETGEVVSAKRLDGLNNVRRDVQVERLTAEPLTLASTDEMVFAEVVEIRARGGNFAGFAMLALDLAASEQLTAAPRVTVDVEGFSDLRLVTGLDGSGNPTFSANGYSANPADLALAMLTNPVWGLGATYAESDIDFASLWAWKTRCVAAIARHPARGGGARPRYACNLSIEEERDGIEWLRVIARTGRAVPVPTGTRWAFIEDKPQPAPVELFTDADLLVDEAGRAELALTRELTTGGLTRGNQVVGQYRAEAAPAEGRVISVAWPASGTQWLGGGSPEPLRIEPLRLDGVTDDEQALAEVRYECRRQRLLARTVSFVVAKPYVAVQPGDRFDTAFSVFGWGRAGGRLAANCTASTLYVDRPIEVLTGDVISIQHADGTTETATVIAAPGTYAVGAAVAVSGLTQAPAEHSVFGLGPLAVGTAGKAWLCTAVQLADAERLTWRIEGIEYDPAVYDDAAEAPSPTPFPPSDVRSSVTPPGPVLALSAQDRSGGGVNRVELGWSQSDADAIQTVLAWVYRRAVGGSAWVRVSTPVVGTRSLVLDVTDSDLAYEFAVVAVSAAGYALSPDDARVPKVAVVFGLAAPAPAAPASASVSQAGTGANGTLSWDAVSGAVGYQVLFGGDTTSRPNVGAEDCLVLARVSAPATSLGGLHLPTGRACRFFVRSVGPSGRLSSSAATVNVASPTAPGGTSVKGSARVFDLAAEGTRTNLTWDSGQSRLELTDASADGVYLSPEIDTGSVTAATLQLRLATASDPEDPAANHAQAGAWTLPGLEADQWGTYDPGSGVVIGLLMPPYPDDRQRWIVETRVHDGTLWSGWTTWAHALSGFAATFGKYQVRITLRRGAAPYRPTLRALAAVVVH